MPSALVTHPTLFQCHNARSSSAAPVAELGNSAMRGRRLRAPSQAPVLAGALWGQPGLRKPPAVQLQCRSRVSRKRQFYHRGNVSGNSTLNLITTMQDTDASPNNSPSGLFQKFMVCLKCKVEQSNAELHYVTALSFSQVGEEKLRPFSSVINQVNPQAVR